MLKEHFRVELPDGSAALLRYSSTSDISKLTGRDQRWVQRNTRNLELAPELTLGERQWGRADVTKLLLLSRLQTLLGEKSATPFKLVAAACGTIESILDSPDVPTLIKMGSGNDLTICVTVPSIEALIARASA